MDQSTGVLLGVLGLALVCIGLLFVLLLVILRLTGRNFMSFFSLLLRNRVEAESDSGPAFLPRRRPDLRARAEAAKQALDAASTSSTSAQGQAHVKRPRRTGRDSDPRTWRERDDDELLGGMLDDEEG